MAELTTKYTLELDEIEALILFAIISKVAGSGTNRIVLNGIIDELGRQSIVDDADFIKLSGKLTFEE